MSDFQSAAVWQGRHFDETCRFLLRHAGFEVSERPFVDSRFGVEIDARAFIGEQEVWLEFKGSYQGERPGLRRTDTLKKAIGVGSLLVGSGYPFIVLTSHLPAEGSLGDVMLRRALSLGYFDDVICVHDVNSMHKLAQVLAP